ncbi:MAG: class III extradiol ring-cleavage dioxygenase [Candidatus Thermoplasmatota archaeon]
MAQPGSAARGARGDSGIVYGLFAPNGPNLVAPQFFGGAGAETAKVLRGLDISARNPDTIVVASPHWLAPEGFLVHTAVRPPCIHDYYGFPEEMYRIGYDAPGDPDLARILVEAGQKEGLPVEGTTEWGLDHGAWTALYHVASERRIPVVPLSIGHQSAQEHLRWGHAIGAALAQSGRRVLFVGTGSIFHRFDRVDMSGRKRWPEAEAIEADIIRLILARDADALAAFDRRRWEEVAPEGDLGALFMLLGALGGDFRARLVNNERVFGSFGMTVIEFLQPERDEA